jgi:hypothetical protein
MTRITPATDGNPNNMEEDSLYQGVLSSAKKVKSKNAQYPEDQIEVDWELRQGVKQRDWLSLRLGIQAATKQPSKLRQLLNALAEKPKDAELWFDADTLEWGYDLDGDDETPAYAKLTAGMLVNFKGELRDNRYKITRYAAVSNGQTKKRKSASPPVDVDPGEIPF